jgi:hypothetical protein
VRECAAVLSAFGVTGLTFMMVMYGLERRNSGFVLAFACGCGLASAYGFLSADHGHSVVGAVWAIGAVHRYRSRCQPGGTPACAYGAGGEEIALAELTLERAGRQRAHGLLARAN